MICCLIRYDSTVRSGVSDEVKKSETSDLLRTHGFDDVIMNGENSRFSRMMFDIGRLARIEHSDLLVNLI